jgi:hypothetical protein
MVEMEISEIRKIFQIWNASSDDTIPVLRSYRD